MRIAGLAGLLLAMGCSSGQELLPPSGGEPTYAILRGTVNPPSGSELVGGLHVRIAVYPGGCNSRLDPFGELDSNIVASVAPDGSYRREIPVGYTLSTACLVARVEVPPYIGMTSPVRRAITFKRFAERDSLSKDFDLLFNPPSPSGLPRAVVRGTVTPAPGQLLPSGLVVRIVVFEDVCPTPAWIFGGDTWFALVEPDGSYRREMYSTTYSPRTCLVTRVEKSIAEPLVTVAGDTLRFKLDPERDSLTLDFTLP